jgi:RsiW-degrading membrane proteinase PrsW (M82 family)
VSDLVAYEDLLLLLIASLLPALVYLSWVRTTERYDLEPWGPLLSAFFYGALFATIVAAILEGVLLAVGTQFSQSYPAPEFTFLNGNSTLGAFFLVLVLAPVVEEGLKASGVVRAADRIRYVSDGLVLGAAVGLGFGFFETFLYGLGAFVAGGLVAGLGLIVVRSLSSVLLHGSTTAMFGYGYATNRLLKRPGYAGAYYLLAVAMHGSFNALASLGAIVAFLGFSSTISDYASLIGLVLVFVYAFAAIEHARAVIHRTERPAGSAGPGQYRTPAAVRPHPVDPRRYR